MPAGRPVGGSVRGRERRATETCRSLGGKLGNAETLELYRPAAHYYLTRGRSIVGIQRVEAPRTRVRAAKRTKTVYARNCIAGGNGGGGIATAAAAAAAAAAAQYRDIVWSTA